MPAGQGQRDARHEPPNYEADDIGTLAQAGIKRYETLIVSGDRDLTQLATELRRLPHQERGHQTEHFTPAYMLEVSDADPIY